VTAELSALSLAALGLALLDWVLWMSVWTGLLFVGARCIDALTARRVSPGWRALLYATLAIRVLLPVRWTAPLGLSAVVTLGAPLGAAGDAARDAALAPALQLDSAAAASGGALLWTSLLVPAYVLVALLLCALWLRTRARIERALGEPLVGAPSNPPVLSSEGFGPAVVGLFRPRIAVPSALAAELPSGALDWIVRHERAHVRRGDHIVLAAVQFTTVLLWPLLPVWFAAARVRALIELACDETTLEGAAPSERRSYQETLLMLASHNTHRVVPRSLSHAVPAFGGGSLVERVRSARRTSSLPGLVQGAIVLLSALLMTACSGLGAEREFYDVDDDEVVLLSLRAQGLDRSNNAEPGQVYIETKMIATSEETADWLVPAVAQDGGEVVIQLIEEDSRVRILTCPGIVTQDGQEATLFVGNTRVVLVPAAGEPDHVRPVAVELAGGATNLVQHGIKIRLVSDPAIDGVRSVQVRFVRVADGKLMHRLDRKIQLTDGRTVLLRVKPVDPESAEPTDLTDD